MELKLKDGDYVADGIGNLLRAEGSEALLARVLFKLTARRGSFPFLPKLGSRLYLLGQEKNRQSAAEQAVAEALAEEEIDIDGVFLTELGAGKSRLELALRYRGEPLRTTLDV